MPARFSRSETRRVVLVMAVGAILALAVVGVAVWHWYPGGNNEATQAMRQTMERVLRSARVSVSPPTPSAHPSTERERLLASAWKLKGVPYSYGAKGPTKLDCSGFTRAAYEGIGLDIPNGSFNQDKGEQPLTSIAQLKAGDLLFYRWANQKHVSHVTIYAGDGWVIGTGTPGEPPKVVVYPITNDLKADGRVITYRHIRLSDEASDAADPVRSR